MAVGFHSVPYSSDICSICRDSMDNIEDVKAKGGIVAHDGNDGAKHAMHRDCIKTALKINSLCPVCRVYLNEKSLLTWQERTITELCYLVDDGLEAAILGTALGIGVLILLSKRVGFAALALIGMAAGAYGAMNGGRTAEMGGSILLSKTILLMVVGVTGVWMAAKMMHRLSEKR